ncbi:MAG TPA: cupin domain-containing protein [Candidatus Acidoferrum sp.]|nr:cupin domain-containing protein [Candidatus Acidoferrum sp.]
MEMELPKIDSSAKILYDLGLTRLQVQALLVLLRLGTSTPAQIAKACSIHRVEGYRIMKELNMLGLVEQRLSDKRSTFSVISPKSMFANLISIKAEELKVLRERSAQCLPLLEGLRNSINNEPETDKEARFRVTLGEKKSNETTTRMWRQAKNELLIMLPRENAIHVFNDSDHQRILQSISTKRVSVRLMMELDSSIMKVAKSLERKCKVRICDQVFTHMTIVDGSQIILGGGYTTENRGTQLASLWTDSKSFIYSMKRFFEELWKDSFSLEQKLASMEGGENPPRTEVLRSKTEIDELFTNVIARAKSRLMISLGNETNGLLKNIIKDLDAAHKRGLQPSVMMKIDDHARTTMVEDLLKIAAVKHCQQIPFTALITDYEMVLCTVMGTETEVLWLTSKELVNKFYSVAQNIFQEGKNGSARLWEIKTGTEFGEGLFRQVYTSNDSDLIADLPAIDTALTRGEGDRIYRKMPGITYYHSFDSRACKLQGGYAILEAGADSGFYFHAGEEVSIVVKGTLTIDVDKEEFTLHEGDTLHFPSSAPHRMRNLSKNSETVKVFTVTYPQSF